MTPLKYQLTPGDNKLQIPGGPSGSHLAFQQGVPTLWTTVNLTRAHEELHVYLAVTGETLPYKDIEYLGTALSEGGDFVVHAYRIEKERT